ncbi:MAG: hypothetical protein ABI624_06605 [Casimicrobiaceae bacterium]
MPCTIPDLCHVKRCDAMDIAEEIVLIIEMKGPLALYVESNGAVRIAVGNSIDPGDNVALVGVYDEKSTACAIADDILAMQREPIHGHGE